MSGETGAGAAPFWAEDPDGAAGEYVLGTLPADERAAFARALERDASLRAAVATWEVRLAPLAAAVQPVAPAAGVWDAIEARIASDAPDAGGACIVTLQRKLRNWRRAAGAATALAAGLALWLALGPPPVTTERQYFAVVDRGGALPALIVRVDLGSGTVQVRSLAAETPPNRSLELWYVGAGAAPRSLGLVGDAVARLPLPADLRTGAEAGRASLAVSVEPKGGSPTGAPTGPVVYSGTLVRE